MGKWYFPQSHYEEIFLDKYKGEHTVNRTYLLGRIGKEIETSNVNGNYLAKTSLATTKRWKDKQGNQQEKTTWHNLVAWGKTAEILKEKTEKGSRVFIEGEIDNGSYEKKDGSKGYFSQINVSNVNIIDFKKEAEQDSRIVQDDLGF